MIDPTLIERLDAIQGTAADIMNGHYGNVEELARNQFYLCQIVAELANTIAGGVTVPADQV